MARRRREGARVFGPYLHGKRWRIEVVREGGEKDRYSYESEKQALQVKRALEKELSGATACTLIDAIGDYEVHLRDVKGNKPKSYNATIWRLKAFFPDLEMRIDELTTKNCAAYYQRLTQQVSPRTGRPLSVDSHRNILAETRTFLNWCVKSKRWLTRNPLDGVEGQGKRRHGKPQLRIDEARRWLATAMDLADKGEDGAVAAAAALLMGLRAGEVVSRVVRDLDDEGRLLWIPDSKTEAGRRTQEIPEALRPHMLGLAKGKLPLAHLFGRHCPDWVNDSVQRICRLAGVPEVCAHSMRGLHSTLALARGTSGHVVAASLGHESIDTTLRSYADRGTVVHAQQAKVVSVLTDRAS